MGAVGMTPPVGCAVPATGHEPGTTVAPTICAVAGFEATGTHMPVVGTEAVWVPHAASP